MPRGVGSQWQYDEAQLQRRLWNPSVYGLDCRMWIKPSDVANVRLDGSNRVSDVIDLSPYRANFTQATAGSRPTFRTSNVADGIENLGTSLNFMLRDVGSSQLVSDVTIFLAVTFTGDASFIYPTFLSASSTVTGDDYATGFTVDRRSHNATNPVSTYGLDSPKDNTNPDLLDDTIAYNSPTIITVRARDQSGTESMRVNGREQGLTKTPFSPNASMNLRVMRLFVRYYNNNLQAYERGIISEMVVIGTTLSAFECAKIEGYISWSQNRKYRLAATHPFVNRPPLIGD